MSQELDTQLLAKGVDRRHGSRPITHKKADNLHTGGKKHMSSIKGDVFFDIIYRKVNPYNTAFMAKKYRLYPICFLCALLYFSCNEVSYIPRDGREVIPRDNSSLTLDGLIEYQKRELLAKDLIENRSHFAKTFTPLKV
jgi:hypothetical protein